MRVPPAFTQRYVLRRGGREGQAELVLGREGARYTMSLRGWVDGADLALAAQGFYRRPIEGLDQPVDLENPNW